MTEADWTALIAACACVACVPSVMVLAAVLDEDARHAATRKDDFAFVLGLALCAAPVAVLVLGELALRAVR